MQQAVVDPLRAQPITLIAGTFTLALAGMLIYFIFSSPVKSRNGKSAKDLAAHAQKNRINLGSRNRREVALFQNPLVM